MKKRSYKIDPLFVKNDKGKTTHVYLDWETFQNIVKEITDFEKMLKRKREKEKQEKEKRKLAKAKKSKKK